MDLSYFTRGARSAELSRQRMQRSGFTMRGDRLWTEKEKQIVRQYPGDYDSIRKRLRHRTRTAIRAQSGKMGLTKTIHFWSMAELSKLRRLYPAAPQEEICATFPHSTWINIRQAARYHGFRRGGKRPYKLTGFSAIDEVRKRCYEIGWTMRDLDAAARTGSYFRQARWIGKKINHRAVGRAIEALDGVVQAKWNS